MIEITQADRDAAAEILGMYEGMGHRGRCISGVLDIHPVIDIVAAHRTQSTADLQAKLDMAVEALEEMLEASKDISCYLRTLSDTDFDCDANLSSTDASLYVAVYDGRKTLAAIKGAKNDQ